jgi:hypothetical protein
MSTTRCLLVAVAIGAIGALGCSTRPNLAPVRGTVTLNGKPLPPCQGRISFHPEKGRMATAALEADGSFVLTTFDAGDGALVGPHKVTIKATRIVKGGSGPKSVAEEAIFAKKGVVAAEPRVLWIVPEKYSDTATSPLTATVERSSNVINFDVVP